MNNGSPSEHIRQEMAAARAALARDARAAVTDARTLTDWRHHFRAHPWLFCGGAAALGFLLVPHRERSRPLMFPSPAEPAEAGAQAPSTASIASVATTLLGVGASFAARQSLNYLTRRGLHWFEARSAAHRPPAETQGSSQPGGPS